MDAKREDPTTSARTTRDRRLLLLFVLVALVPIVGAALRLHHAGWVPEGDDAMIARRTISVFTHHPPTTGQPSTAGNLFTYEGGRAHAASIEASHPGPLEYYVLAIPYRISGWSPAGLLAAVALVNGAAAACVVWLSWRRLGSVGAAAGCIAVLVVAAHLGTWNLARPLNANVAVLPLLAGLVATWAALDRDRAAVVPGVVALSFVIQAHLGAAPVGAAALLVCLGASARTWWQARRDDAGGRRWVVPAATAVALAACWALVAVQQLGGHPGNVAKILDVARLKIDRAGPAFGASAVFDQVARPAWPGVPPLPRISILGPIPVGSSLAKGAVLLALLIGAAWWARRAERAVLVRAAAVALGAILVPIAVLTRGPDEVRLGPSYQLTSLVAVSAFVTLTLLATLVEAIRPWLAARTIPRVVEVAIAVLVVLGIATTLGGGPTYPADAARTRAVADAIRAQVPQGTYKLSGTGTWAYLSTLDAVSVELIRHGYDVRVVRLGSTPDEPIYRNTRVDAPTIQLDSTDVPRATGTLLIRRGPLPEDPSWAGHLLAAVSAPNVRLVSFNDPHLTVRSDVPPVPTPLAPCVEAAYGVHHTETAAGRRHVVRAVLRCSQTDRRTFAQIFRWQGLDPFWVDLLGSNMPGPYPHTGLAAYLDPAGS